MKRILIFCYLAYFLTVLIPVGFSEDSEPPYSLWLEILGTVSFFLAAIAIFLYGLSYKPKPFSWIWKFVPFTLIVMVCWPYAKFLFS